MSIYIIIVTDLESIKHYIFKDRAELQHNLHISRRYLDNALNNNGFCEHYFISIEQIPTSKSWR